MKRNDRNEKIKQLLCNKSVDLNEQWKHEPNNKPLTMKYEICEPTLHEA